MPPTVAIAGGPAPTPPTTQPFNYVYLCDACDHKRPSGSVQATVEIGGCMSCRTLKLVNVYRLTSPGTEC